MADEIVIKVTLDTREINRKAEEIAGKLTNALDLGVKAARDAGRRMGEALNAGINVGRGNREDRERQHFQRLEQIARVSAAQIQAIEARKLAQLDLIRERNAQRAIEHERKIQREAQRSANAFDLVRSTVGRLSGAFAALGGALALKQIADTALQAAINIDKTRQTLIALTGSADAANTKLAELRKLAATSPGVTATFASELFAQLKAIGNIAEPTINRVIKAIGKLNAVFTIDSPTLFAGNLRQIFDQGFERSDVKEALGRVPIFEQLLESAFGTKDPGKLRRMKEAGRLTLDAFLSGISDAVQKDPRFAQIQESIGARLAKAKDNILTALAPLGEELANVLLPVLKGIEVAINGLFNAAQSNFGGIRKVVTEVTDFIGARFRDAVRIFQDNREAINELRKEFARLSEEVKPLVEALGEVIKHVFANAFRGALIAAQTFVSVLTNVLRNVLNGIETVRSALSRVAEGGALIAGTVALGPGGGAALAAGVRAALGPQARGTGQGLDGEEITAADFARLDAALRAGGAGGGGGGTSGRAGRGSRDRFVNDFGLGDAAKLQHEIELARIAASNRAVAERREREAQAAGRPAQLAGFAAAQAERIRQVEIEDATLARNTAQKALEELQKLPPILSDSERFMKGFADATESVGGAFERFGSNVARAFSNVRDLFGGLKQAVLGFFNDLVGSTLQNLVKSTLGSLFGGLSGALGGAGRGGGGGISGVLGNIFRTPSTFPTNLAQAFAGAGGGGGLAAPPSLTGQIATGIFANGAFARGLAGSRGLDQFFGAGVPRAAGSIGSSFSFGAIGRSLAAAAPLLGLSLGGGIGRQSAAGQILGSAGGLLGGLVLGASTGAIGGSLGSAFALSGALGPAALVAAPLLLAGGFLLGKAKQRRQDEEASGQMLTQALQGIDQLAQAVASGQITTLAEARSIFESQVIGQFRAGINTLKTESVRKSRLTNQVRDLHNVFEKRIPPLISEQERKAADARRFAAIDSRLVPQFASGGIVGGLDRGFDSVRALLRPGEMVLTQAQQFAVARQAGADVFRNAGVPGVQPQATFQHGGIAPAGASTGPIVIELDLDVHVGMSKSGAEEIFVAGATNSRTGEGVVIELMQRNYVRRGFTSPFAR